MVATIAKVLDTRHSTKSNSGLYPVRIRITHEREQRYYDVLIHSDLEQVTDVTQARPIQKLLLSTQDWEILKQEKVPKAFREVKSHIDRAYAKAVVDVNSLSDSFTFYEFESRYGKRRNVKGDVKSAYDEYIVQLKKEERQGTVESYSQSLNSLLKFSPKLTFNEITPAFLSDYEHWMRNVEDETIKKKKCSKTTVGIYLRALKAIFNSAIDEGIVKQEAYPFGRKKGINKKGQKYRIPKSSRVKKALTEEDLSKLYYYEVKEDHPAVQGESVLVFLVSVQRNERI